MLRWWMPASCCQQTQCSNYFGFSSMWLERLDFPVFFFKLELATMTTTCQHLNSGKNRGIFMPYLDKLFTSDSSQRQGPLLKAGNSPRRPRILCLFQERRQRKHASNTESFGVPCISSLLYKSKPHTFTGKELTCCKISGHRSCSEWFHCCQYLIYLSCV